MVDMDKMRRVVDIDDTLEMISDIEQSSGVEFSDWEAEFIESIGEQLGTGRALAEDQHEKLREIWNKV